ncbi:MAG TPA: hypothetical protein VME40_17200, partial [Caulobacteraceae bacterium]|nr:hypothetical protein [Caulobacteraceae bacterium]
MLAVQALVQSPAPPLAHADAVVIAQALAQARLEGIETPDPGAALDALASADPSARESASAALTS